jgi:pilus assembly protein Flp/PilA
MHSIPAEAGKLPIWGSAMSTSLLKIYLRLKGLESGEEGQDLVEYALLVSLVALVCIAGVNNVATAVNSAFSSISNSLT